MGVDAVRCLRIVNACCAGSIYAPASTNAWYLATSLDLRRAALFLWITPLLATRSSTLTACSVADSATPASPAAIANSAFLTNVRASVRKGLLRSRRRWATRIRFFEDLELAKFAGPPTIDTVIVVVPRQRAKNSTKSKHFTQHEIDGRT